MDGLRDSHRHQRREECLLGYTGPEAVRFKLAYIEAFNALETELQRHREGALPPAPRKFSPSSTVSRKPLERLVKVWASQSGLLHAQCWTMLNTHLGLEKITELPEEWIPDAVAWVQELTEDGEVRITYLHVRSRLSVLEPGGRRTERRRGKPVCRYYRRWTEH